MGEEDCGGDPRKTVTACAWTGADASKPAATMTVAASVAGLSQLETDMVNSNDLLLN
jgi:hypothetical protein